MAPSVSQSSHHWRFFVNTFTICIVVYVFMYGILPSSLFANGWGPTISEIHYHPIDDPDETLEFIEIYNRDPSPYDLSGYRFSEGIEFEFPPETFLAGKSFAVLVSDPTAFTQRYPHVEILGAYDKKLGNSGDTLVLSDPSGLPVLKARYKDRAPWPTAPDGLGVSLVLKDLFLDPSKGANWTWSLEEGGTPGAPNFPSPPEPDVSEIIPPGSQWKMYRGVEAPTNPITIWSQADLDDSSWEDATVGVGYGDGDDTTTFFDMRGVHSSVYLRKRFELSLDELNSEDEFILKIRFDDAFVAYLNGHEFARANIGVAGNRPAHESLADQSHEAESFETFYLPRYLLSESNVLSIVGFNESLTSSDFTLDPYLVWRKIKPLPTSARSTVVINEWYGERLGNGWIELYNQSLNSVSLDSLALANFTNPEQPYLFEEGIVLAPGEYFVIEEEELPFNLQSIESSTTKLKLSDRFTGSILDAQSFKAVPSSEGRLSWSRISNGEGNFQLSQLSPGLKNVDPELPPLVINEIQYHPHNVLARTLGVAPRELEFIELFNLSSEVISLEGIHFDEGIEFEFPNDAQLGPNDFLVVAANPELIQEHYNLEEVYGPWEGTLSNSGEKIELKNAFDQIVDQVRYFDGGNWAPWADGGGSSLELRDPYANNNVGSSWAISKEEEKTSWTTIEYTGEIKEGESEFHIYLGEKGEILIDDIQIKIDGASVSNYLPHGSFEGGNQEWIIQGNHIQSKITNSNTHEAYEGQHALLIHSSGQGDTRINKIESDTTPILPDNGKVHISYKARWLKGTSVITTRGSSHGFAHTAQLPISLTPGTPGKHNSQEVNNLGPTIDSVEHFPCVPTNLQRIRVSARVRDPDEVLRVHLYFKGERSQKDFRINTMRDDGFGRDTRKGDGIYSTEIPGYPVGEKVKFFIIAEDLKSGITIFPSSNESFIFQVDGSSINTEAHSYRLVLSDYNTEILETREVLSDELLESTFIFEDRPAYYHVGTRYRGSPWIRPSSEKSLRIRFPDDNSLFGENKLNLDASGKDLRERAAYYMLRHHGKHGTSLPHSRQVHTRLTFNGSDYGIFEKVEPVDKAYLRRWFPQNDSGYLYKTDLRLDINDQGKLANIYSIGLFDQGPDKEEYRGVFNPRSRENLDHFDTLIELVQKIDPQTTSEEALLIDIENHIDVDQWIRTLGARLVNDDWDTFGIGAKNAYFFRADGDGLWRLLPWDSDNTFDDAEATLEPSEYYRSIHRLFTLPKFRRKYLANLKELLNGPFNQEFLSTYLSSTKEALASEELTGDEKVYAFIEQRTPHITALIPEPKEFSVWTPSPSFVDTLTFQIIGSAPLNTEFIVVNGKEVLIDWKNSQDWNIELALEPGFNSFDIYAFSDTEDLLGEYQLEVTTSASWPQPKISSIQPNEGPEEGENIIEIHGTNFRAGLKVYFQNEPALEVEWISNELVLVKVPPHSEGEVSITVENDDQQSDTLELAYKYFYVPPTFIRGDTNNDGTSDITDVVRTLTYLFGQLQDPIACRDSADSNDDGKLDITDPIYLLFFLFMGESEPLPPYPQPGPDPTEDSLPECPKL